MSALGVVYYATGITRPAANDNRVVSQDDAEKTATGSSASSGGWSDSTCEVQIKNPYTGQVIWTVTFGGGSCHSSSSSSGSSTESSRTIKYADGSYVKTSKSKSSGETQSINSGDGDPIPGPGGIVYGCGTIVGEWPDTKIVPTHEETNCSTSSSTEGRETQDFFYSDTFVESVFESSSTSNSEDSCGKPGNTTTGETRREKYYAIGIETVKQGDGEVYNLTCMHSAGRTISPTPSDGQPEDTIEGPMNFGGAFGVTPELLYGTTQTTGEFIGFSSTQETERTHIIGVNFDTEYIEFTKTYTDVAVSYDEASKIPFTFKSAVPTSWRNYRAINPGTTNYAAFLTPERYAKNGLALFFTQSPTKGQYLAAKNTDWGTSFAISQVGIEAVEGIPPDNAGHVTVTYDMVTWKSGVGKSTTVLSSVGAGPDERRFFSTEVTDGAYQSLAASEATLKYETGHAFNTDVNGYYSSGCFRNILTTSMTTISVFNLFTSETTNIRSLFDTSKATLWMAGAPFPTYTTSTQSSTSFNTSTASEVVRGESGSEGESVCQITRKFSESASSNGSASGETRGSSFPLPYIATPALFLGKNKPSVRPPLVLEGVAKGLGVPLGAPFRGATHDNTWAVFRRLGVDNHAREFAAIDDYAENPGAYFIPYNGSVWNTDYEGNQIMSWSGSSTSVTLNYKMNGATKTQSKSAVISPSTLGSITRTVLNYPVAAAWLNASPCASGRGITFADGNVMVTKSEYSAITGTPPDGTPILDADAISPYLASFSKMTINKVGGGDNAMPSIQFGAAIGHDSPASAAAYYWHA